MGRDHKRDVLIAIAAALVAAGPVRAQPDDVRDRARAHYERAEEHFGRDEFARAAVEYQAAHDLVPRPGLLFNIGLSYENAGEAKQALEFYRQYLSVEPDGIKAAEARTRAEALKIYLASQQPPQPEVPPERRSFWPAIGAFGAALVLAGVGTGFAIHASQIGDELDGELETGLPPLDSADPRIDRGRRSAVIANVAFAGAGIAAIVGAVLTVRVVRDPARRPRRAAITGGPGLAGVGFEVSW